MAGTKVSDPKTVDEYMANVSPKFRPVLQRLRKTIRGAAPAAEEVISYKMPAFKLNGILVYYSAFSDHCSFFVASSRLYRQFSKELKPFQSGRGTLRFTAERPLPVELVRRLVKARIAENAARRAK